MNVGKFERLARDGFLSAKNAEVIRRLISGLFYLPSSRQVLVGAAHGTRKKYLQRHQWSHHRKLSDAATRPKRIHN
jgi:hypothetical protein